MGQLMHANKGGVDAVALLRKRNEGRRGSTLVIGKQAKQRKRKRRFGSDDRTWTQKNLTYKRIAAWGSLFCQFAFFAAAAYFSYRVFWDGTIAGAINTGVGVGFIGFVAYMQYLTSDGFWDRMARGEFNIGFMILNFVVIWGVVAAITIGGTFLYGVDSKEDPNLTEHPAVAGIRAEIGSNTAKIGSYEDKIAALEKDRTNYVQHGRDKGALRHNVQNERTKYVGSIEALEMANSELSHALSTQYGVSAQIDAGKISMHSKIEDTKIYFRIGIMFILLVLFEIARRFDSKWEEAKYAEQVLAGEIEDRPYLNALMGKS